MRDRPARANPKPVAGGNAIIDDSSTVRALRITLLRLRMNTNESTAYRPGLVEYLRAQARPVDKFSHQARLHRLAVEIGSGFQYDEDVLFAAAWLHDLGVFAGHRPEELAQLATWDHVAYVNRRAPEVLTRLGFPVAKIPAVQEAIRTHQPADDPTTIEGTILRDADLLEQLGATAVLRTVSKVGRDTRFATCADALRVLQGNLERLPAKLRLPAARRLAGPRVVALRAFLDQARSEAGAVPW